MRPAILMILFLYCKTNLASNNTTSLLPSARSISSSPSMNTLSTEGTTIAYNTTEPTRSDKTSFVISPMKTTSSNQMTMSSSAWLIGMPVSPSISTNTRTNTSKNDDEDPTTDTKTALYWGIGGGVGTLALISIGILICGCFSKYKSQRRVDVSSEHPWPSDMPLGDCPSWRHVNVKHPLSSRITERTEHSSSY